MKGEDNVPIEFTLHMMIEGKEDYQVIIGGFGGEILTFRYAGEDCYVEYIYGDNELFECSAQVNDLADPSYVTVGSTSSIANMLLEYEDLRYPRDKETLMYIIKSEYSL